MNTKRKIFIGAAALAAVSLVGAGSFAFFVDSEVSANQSLTAGTLDLDIGLQVTPDINLTNVAPGDSGTVRWALENKGSITGDLSLQVALTEDLDNSCNEPEDRAETPAGDGIAPHDACGTAGELDDAIILTIWDDQSGSWTPDWTGTLRQLHDQTTGATPAARHPFFQLTPGGTRLLGVNWSVPSTAGNVIQSDSVKFHIDLKLDQQTAPPA